ncbi:2-dehydropantoate 2-reductase [Photobacterium aquae]|uniref:2-dehydropantoate 2-reductase n=1 Tax=Photobacterium aquae TaxID=1195763 RepID=A0A0J1H282_9GAMM|nr:2-dehydropantoate 2-reductase [Photobacterium aquae]KLV05949.1 2-dehydropantoate 2-reductase [Photobacterium aquae]
MKITIVGAGAVGSLWACRLAARHQVHLWTRHNTDQCEIRFQPLGEEKIQTWPFKANDPTQLAQADIVIFTVKAFQLHAALATVEDLLPPSTPIVVMHNGMGTHDTVLNQLPDHPILYATTAQGALRTEQGVTHTGLGPTRLGAMNLAGKQYQHLAAVFDQALAPCQWLLDIRLALWQKLAINCAINPLTAILQCRNGHLALNEFTPQLTQICEEVAAVMSAEGYPTTVTDLLEQTSAVISATAANKSSMNQDVYHQRTTEIDYITGYLIARADSHGIAVPANRALWQQIKQLEQHYHDH